MDVDIVLNSVLDTYAQDEIARVQKSRVVQEESRKTVLFRNGQPYMDIIEVTIEQSVTRQSIPVYTMGSSQPVSYVSGRERRGVSGKLVVALDKSKYRVMSPAFDTGERLSYNIETTQLFSDGSSLKIRICNVELQEEETYIPSRVHYTYKGELLEQSNGR